MHTACPCSCDCLSPRKRPKPKRKHPQTAEKQASSMVGGWRNAARTRGPRPEDTSPRPPPAPPPGTARTPRRRRPRAQHRARERGGRRHLPGQPQSQPGCGRCSSGTETSAPAPHHSSVRRNGRVDVDSEQRRGPVNADTGHRPSPHSEPRLPSLNAPCPLTSQHQLENSTNTDFSVHLRIDF